MGGKERDVWALRSGETGKGPTFPCELVIDMTPDYSIAWRHYTAGYTLTRTEKNDLKQYRDVFAQLNILNIREIAVVRSLKTCMHCVQRTAFYTSYLGLPPQFRKLCRMSKSV